MAESAKGLMRSKMPLLAQVLTVLVRDQHRQLLAIQLADIGSGLQGGPNEQAEAVGSSQDTIDG